MTLDRTDVADGAMAMIDVVPMNESAGPGPSFIKPGKASGAGARVRGLDAQSVQHRQHGGGLERGTVVPVTHRFGLHGGDPLGQRRASEQVGGVSAEWSLACTSQPTILRLYRSRIRYRWNQRPVTMAGR